MTEPELPRYHAEDEGEQITDKMEQLKYYARIAQNLAPERKVNEIRIRGEKGAKKIIKAEQRNAMEREQYKRLKAKFEELRVL